MKKKLGIIIPVLLVLIVGAFVAVYFVMPRDAAHAADQLSSVSDQTDSTEASGTVSTTETLAASTELSGDELHALFEKAYIESLLAMRNYLGETDNYYYNYECNKIEELCEVGKTLPDNYKGLYSEWKETYRIKDLSIVFNDANAVMYVKHNTTAYNTIYKNDCTDEEKISLVVGEKVTVSGYGYGPAYEWYRIETGGGTYYVSGNLSHEYVEEEQLFTDCDKTMYAISDEVSIMMEPKVSSDKVDSLSVGDSVHIIGAGKYALTGWYKVEVNGQEYYILGRYLSDTKPTSSNQGSQSQGNTSNQSGNSSQSNGSSSGGTQDSGGQQNGTSNSGGQQSSESDYFERKYGAGMTGEYIRDNLTDEEKIALGFTQRSDGTWVDETGYKLPSRELSESEIEASGKSSEGVKWGSG